MDFPVVSEAQIRAMAGEYSFDQGLTYFEQAMVESVLQRGSIVQAVVGDRHDALYDVSLQAQAAEQLSIQCNCCDDLIAICAHSVAVLLFLLYCPDQVVQQAPIRATLDELDDHQLCSLLLDVADQHPEVSPLVEQRIGRLGF